MSPNLFISQQLTPPWHLPYMDIGVTKQNNRLNSRDNKVIWRHECINIMNTDDSQITWLVHVTDVIFGTNPVLFSFWFAPESKKFSIYSGPILPLQRSAFPAQIRCPTIREVTPPIFQQQLFECSAVSSERLCFHFCFYFQLFLCVIFSL